MNSTKFNISSKESYQGDGSGGQDQRSVLDAKVSEYHIYTIASDVKDWEVVAPYLSLTESDQKEIKENLQDDYYGQKREALSKWRLKNGSQASYRELISICHSQGLTALAETIAKYPGSKEQPRSIPILDSLYHNLLTCYHFLPHPSKEQVPSKHSGLFSTMCQCEYLDLILHEAPMKVIHDQGQVGVAASESIAKSLKEVTLQGVLSSKGKLLIYFEGIAGSGKTTLSWHACQEWARKKILTHFQLLLHVQLNDPYIHSAIELQDIIPSDNKKFRKEVAMAIMSLKGEGICFLLDGLDEASPQLLDFLLHKLIPGKIGCTKLSFILTSRPNARITERLNSVLSTRIIMAGFKTKELHQFFDQTLGAKSEERQKLGEICTINPRVEGLCSLPLNAVIMSYLINFIKDQVPTTQTELYIPLISNFLRRHMDSHFPHIDSPCIEDLLNDIPSEICESFDKVCLLAYSSSLSGKQLFTTKELGHATLIVDNTLGFLQVHSSISRFGPKPYYRFDHLLLQEFLAAIHLSKLGNDDQVSAVKQLLSMNPLSQILPFYAGLTKLSNNSAFKCISVALSQAVEIIEIEKQLLQSKGDPGKKALAFFNCLFECHEESFLKLPETNMSVDKCSIKEALNTLKEANLLSVSDMEHSFASVTLHGLVLTSIDCLSLGYYVHMKSCVPTRSPLSMAIILDCCSLDHTGIRAFIAEFKKTTTKQQRKLVKLQLSVGNTVFDNETLVSFKELLQGSSHLNSLGLCKCLSRSVPDLSFALKCLTEGLSSNSSCVYINLGKNDFRPEHIYYFVLMLRSSSQLRALNISYYDVSSIMPIFCRAVRLSCVQYLELMACNISDSHLIMLGKMICNNLAILSLDIYGNPITHHGLSEFLALFVLNPFKSQLAFVLVHLQLSNHQKETLKLINTFRFLLRRPPLNFKSWKDMPRICQEEQAGIRIREMIHEQSNKEF